MFERFTQSSREVVVAARSEAGALGHRFIGTEHLLHGLLATEAEGGTHEPAAGPVAKVLTAAGVDAAYVRAETQRLVGAGEGNLGEGEADALHSIGIDLEVVRAKLEESFGAGVLDQPSAAKPRGRLPLTGRAKKVLGLSLREARRLGHSSLGPEHILLGLLREPDGIAGRIMAAKVPLTVLRERLLAELEAAA